MDNNKEINWLNIITNKEFQSCLHLELAKNISMISKLVRDKLKPLIFSRIQISSNKLSLPSKNVFIEYINNRYRLISDHSIASDFNNFVKCLTIETGKDDFKSALTHTFSYAKQFHLNSMGRAGCYLYSISSFFNSLSILRLSHCYISLIEFVNFGTLLPSLTYVSFCVINFAKLPSDKISSKDIVYPPNIKKLSILGCEVIATALYANDYDFLFRKNIDHSVLEFTLPNTSMPSLRELTFFEYEESSAELAGFLKLNPNLEVFNSRFLYLNDINTQNSLKTLELDGAWSNEDIYRFPNLESLKNLSINFDGDYLYNSVKQLCLRSLNLERLELFLCNNPYSQVVFDNYLDPIISNLPSLKVLTLDLDTKENDTLNFSKFTQIETLTLHIHSNIVANFNFTNYNHLNKIVLSRNLGKVSFNEVKEKFDSYENWIFSIQEFSIVGFKK